MEPVPLKVPSFAVNIISCGFINRPQALEEVYPVDSPTMAEALEAVPEETTLFSSTNRVEYVPQRSGSSTVPSEKPVEPVDITILELTLELTPIKKAPAGIKFPPVITEVPAGFEIVLLAQVKNIL